MDQCFEGQVALVTGGGKGIGFEIANALALRGAKVAISGRHQDILQSSVEQLAASGLALVMDVRDEFSVQQGIQQVAEWGGAINIVVNNAGIGLLDTPLLQTDSSAWKDVIETNLTGAFYVTKYSWPHLLKSKGQILNVSSIAGTQGFSGASAYCASKFGLNGLTEVLKKEGAESGVRVLSLCPGAVDTDLWGGWATSDIRARMMTSSQLGELAATMLAVPRNIELEKWVVTNMVSPWQA